MTANAETESAGARNLSAGQVIVLAAVLTGAFIAMLDDFIVNVATAAIREDLSAGYAEVTLVVAAYVLVYGLTLITGGRLGDRYGHRQVFLAGIAVFTLGAALFYPQVLALLHGSFTGRARATAFSAFGATVGLAAVAGQLVGGLLVGADLFGLSWRPIFLINVPIGLMVLVLAARCLPRPVPGERPGLDPVGAALSWLPLGALAVPLILGHELGWPLWLIGVLLAAAPAFAAFVLWERALPGRGGSPLLPPGLFAIRSFAFGSAIALLFFAGNSAVFFLLPLHLQAGLGHGALYAGLTFTPLAATFVLGSALAPRLQRRIGTHVLTAGYALAVLGNVGLLLTALIEGPSMTGFALLPSMLVLGFGEGLGMSPLVGATLAEIDESESGAASGVLQTAMQLGFSIGVAVVGSIFFAVLGEVDADPGRYTDAFTVALLAAVALSVAVTALAAALPRGPHRAARSASKPSDARPR